jgi:hypothetical protein
LSGRGPPGVFEGKKLSYQNKWLLETRSWSEAQSKVKDLEKRLKDFAEGKVVPKGTSVEAALREWYGFRDQDGLDNTKAKLMGGKLAEWCEMNNVLLLTALTTDKTMKWRLTLPFRSGDSSSLSVHWSVIRAFFSWAPGMGYFERSPVPNPKMNPQFRIRYKKAEVKPPTKKQVEKILATAAGQVRLLCELMRETAMALVDAMKYAMSQEDAEKYRLSKPERRPMIQGNLIRGKVHPASNGMGFPNAQRYPPPQRRRPVLTPTNKNRSSGTPCRRGPRSLAAGAGLEPAHALRREPRLRRGAIPFRSSCRVRRIGQSIQNLRERTASNGPMQSWRRRSDSNGWCPSSALRASSAVP